MTSRERVLAAFDHKEPDRVPCWCGASVEFWEKAKEQLNMNDEQLRLRFGDDFRRVFAEYDLPDEDLSEEATCCTVFGIERRGYGYGQPMGHPLKDATVEEVHDYPWPAADCVDVSKIRATAESYNKEFAVLGGDWSPFWHDLIDMLGMENMYMKMYDDPELVDAVLGHLVDFYAASSQKIFDAAGDVIDIFFIGNDLGSRNGPLIGPDMFERFILPHLKRLIDLGHSCGLLVQMHCCGGFAPLIPMLIKAGLDGLHAVQPSCTGMDLAALKREFGDRILFNGAIDSHHVLIDGTPQSVKKDTREVLEIMMPGGGFVAGASHDTILEQTPLENVLAMFDTIREAGVY